MPTTPFKRRRKGLRLAKRLPKSPQGGLELLLIQSVDHLGKQGEVVRVKAGYANNDAIAVMAGFKVGDWRFGYSYDITISRLAMNSGGAHEVTTILELADKRKKKSMSRRRVVPCAKF